MKKLKFFTTFMLFLALLLVAACSSDDEVDGEGGGNVAVAIDEASWEEDLEKMGATIKEKSGLGFDINVYPDTTTYQSTLRSSLATEEAPGLFKWWSGFRMEDLVEGGLLADLTSTWETFEEQGVNPDLASAFEFDGKIYGIPMTSNYWVVFYNKHVYEEYDLEIPTTWDEFLQNSETLKQNGVAPLAQNTEKRWPGFIWFEEVLSKSDPELYKKLMVGEASYTDPGVVEAMETWKDLYDRGYFSEPLNWETNMATEFANGNVAMFVKGDWYQNFLTGAGMTPEDYGMFILPTVNPDAQKSVIVEVAPLLVSENSKHKEDALEAAKSIFEEDVIGPWTQSKDISPLVSGGEMPNEEMGKVVDSVENDGYELINRYWEATPPDISEFAVDQFVRFMLNPDEYMDVLEEIEAHASKYWESK
ncbi:ABC transporter substrate-binding protein [Terrihalobacillus insolitus]|uniref:ABC transporter substrate-binding protein n=1 Tax=Terrihalobacillus insolitus TaxID=2950438 RepID=UPI0023419280|nr:extracellular solute-binding protein [Terrihalobacillus insolitus]MDC3415144.1 extracellular solute-binding protein [Terrihalobacillus insolitus]